jgi:hypothetical protein
VKKILALLFLVFLFLSVLILYFFKPQETGETVRAFENRVEKPDYVNKKWYLIGEIQIENGKVINVSYFENAK